MRCLPAKRNRGELGGALFDPFLMLVVLWGFLWQTLLACDVLNGIDPQLDFSLTPSGPTARQLPQSPPMEASTNCPRFLGQSKSASLDRVCGGVGMACNPWSLCLRSFGSAKQMRMVSSSGSVLS